MSGTREVVEAITGGYTGLLQQKQKTMKLWRLKQMEKDDQKYIEERVGKGTSIQMKK